MTQGPEELWTVADLAAISKIAKSTLYQWTHEGLITHIKVGVCIRFRPSEVQAWLNQHAKPGRRHRVPTVEV
jgi:excisionase family DNA binding protein